METKEKVELIQQAIQQLIEEQREKKLSSSSDESSFVVADDGDDHHVLLSRLLSQLEKLKGYGKLQQPEPPANPKELPSPAVEAKSETANEVDGGGVDEGRREEIVKELREVKRQNFITHCLLSAMIVLTVAWQLSKVSLVLKLKDGMNHPFRSFGGMLAGMLKGPIGNAQNGEKQSSTKQQQIEGPSLTSLPPLKISELPHVDLPLGLDSDDD